VDALVAAVKAAKARAATLRLLRHEIRHPPRLRVEVRRAGETRRYADGVAEAARVSPALQGYKAGAQWRSVRRRRTRRS